MFDGLKFKRPAEILVHPFDFASEIPASDSITSQTVTAIDSNGDDASSAIVASSSVSGTTVTAKLQAGVDLEDYRVTYTATMTTSAEVFHKILDLRVRINTTG